jgi:drug/metabolite transporter (DMT)-like permease
MMSLSERSQRTKAILMISATAVLWSVGGVLIKQVNAHPLAIAGARSAIAALVLLASLGRKPHFHWSRAQIGAALGYAGTVILFVAANKLTTAANAILLQFTSPIYAAILGAWLLKERTRWVDWATIAVVLGGMSLFFLDELSAGGMLGNVLGAASGLCFAVFTIFMRMQKDGSPVESVILGNALTAVVGLPFLSLGLPSATGWLWLVILGVFQLGLAYVLYAKAIKHLTALEAILIPVLEPILNPVWAFAFLGEVPGPLAAVGGVIVLGTITGRYLVDGVWKRVRGNGKGA